MGSMRCLLARIRCQAGARLHVSVEPELGDRERGNTRLADIGRGMGKKPLDRARNNKHMDLCSLTI